MPVQGVTYFDDCGRLRNACLDGALGVAGNAHSPTVYRSWESLGSEVSLGIETVRTLTVKAGHSAPIKLRQVEDLENIGFNRRPGTVNRITGSVPRHRRRCWGKWGPACCLTTEPSIFPGRDWHELPFSLRLRRSGNDVSVLQVLGIARMAQLVMRAPPIADVAFTASRAFSEMWRPCANQSLCTSVRVSPTMSFAAWPELMPETPDGSGYTGI